MHLVRLAGQLLLIVLILLGALPLVAAAVQSLLAAAHGFRNHYDKAAPYFPRTAILIPAWNEAAVLAGSIDQLMRLEYPREALRIYVIDDASTDGTPELLRGKAHEYPGNVVHLRREHGGQGKAHTLNHGLAHILTDDWAQAVLVMDADVIYRPDSLRRMAWHLADPRVGAVTAYITEGSRPGNYLTRFIGFEYITAQAAARRGQNVLGALACLAGGAQLHSRANIELLGGRIDTSSLAEDTFTTFNTQLGGHRVVFEPHAVVLAEEPESVVGLWKQRLRWARGNVQVTQRYRRVFFRRSHRHGLGGFWFGLLWFSLFLQPVLLLVSTASLIILYFTDHALANWTFHALWLLSALAWLMMTALTLLFDWPTARHVWRQAVLFPGVISLFIILAQLAPSGLDRQVGRMLNSVGLRPSAAVGTVILLMSYLWLAGSMALAALAPVLEARRGGRFLAPLLVYVAGFGPLLCAVAFTAYLKEWRGAAMTWDKTEKTGRVSL